MDIYHQGILSMIATKILVVVLMLVFVFDFTLFSAPTLARELENGVDIMTALGVKTGFENAGFPENGDKEVSYTALFAMTAYNSEVGQCDSTPCITANGFNVCKHDTEDTIATNVLAFGTRVRIPDLFGDRVFVVRDRMNERYSNKNRIDVWMKSKENAQDFGVRVATIEVLK